MRTLLLAIGSVSLFSLALGCSGGTPTPGTAADTTSQKPEPPNLITVLAEISADQSLADEQALKKMCDVVTKRADELGLLVPTQEGARIRQEENGWLLELDVRDLAAPINLATPQQAAALLEKTRNLSLSILSGEVGELLDSGANRHLNAVRASVYTQVKKDGAVEDVLAFRVLATMADREKIQNWRIWPMAVPPGQPRDDAARKQLESEMWTVEVNEYPNLSTQNP